jgi:hypothetical protein
LAPTTLSVLRSVREKKVTVRKKRRRKERRKRKGRKRKEKTRKKYGKFSKVENFQGKNKRQFMKLVKIILFLKKYICLIINR